MRDRRAHDDIERLHRGRSALGRARAAARWPRKPLARSGSAATRARGATRSEPTPPDCRNCARITLRSPPTSRPARSWDEMQAKNARLAARVDGAGARARERARSASRRRRLWRTRESSRAVALRAELVDYARRVDDARARAAARARRPAPSPTRPKRPATLDPAAPRAAPTGAEPVAGRHRIGDARRGSAAPACTDAIDGRLRRPSKPSRSSKRKSSTSASKSPRSSSSSATASSGCVRRRAISSSVRRELAALRNELDDSRSNVARLERTVIDKDRALEARDAQNRDAARGAQAAPRRHREAQRGRFRRRRVDAPAAARAGSPATQRPTTRRRRR